MPSLRPTVDREWRPVAGCIRPAARRTGAGRPTSRSPSRRRSISSAIFSRSSPRTATSATAASMQEGGLRLNARETCPGRRRLGPEGDRAGRSQGQPAGAGDRRLRCRIQDAARGRRPAADGRASRVDHALDQRGGHLAGRRRRSAAEADHWAWQKPRKTPLPSVQHADWPRHRDRPFRAGAAGSSRLGAGARGRSLHAGAPRVSRSDRPAADARRGRRVCQRPATGRLRADGRSRAGRSGLRRALGPRVARPGALCRLEGLWLRSAAHDLALSRLGDRGLQSQPAVRPVHDRAVGRRPAAAAHDRPDSGHGLSSQHDGQRRGGHRRRGVSRGGREGPHRNHDAGLDGPDDGLRQVPQPQVRSDHAARVLPGLRRSSIRPRTPTAATKRRRCRRPRGSSSQRIAERRDRLSGLQSQVAAPQSPPDEIKGILAVAPAARSNPVKRHKPAARQRDSASLNRASGLCCFRAFSLTAVARDGHRRWATPAPRCRCGPGR